MMTHNSFRSVSERLTRSAGNYLRLSHLQSVSTASTGNVQDTFSARTRRPRPPRELGSSQRRSVRQRRLWRPARQGSMRRPACKRNLRRPTHAGSQWRPAHRNTFPNPGRQASLQSLRARWILQSDPFKTRCAVMFRSTTIGSGSGRIRVPLCLSASRKQYRRNVGNRNSSANENDKCLRLKRRLCAKVAGNDFAWLHQCRLHLMNATQEG